MENRISELFTSSMEIPKLLSIKIQLKLNVRTCSCEKIWQQPLLRWPHSNSLMVCINLQQTVINKPQSISTEKNLGQLSVPWYDNVCNVKHTLLWIGQHCKDYGCRKGSYGRGDWMDMLKQRKNFSGMKIMGSVRVGKGWR